MSRNDEHKEQESVLEKTYSRRNILKTAGVGGLGILIGASGLGGVISAKEGMSSTSAKNNQGNTVPFYGKHQAGIATEKQTYLYFASFDIKTENRTELIDLLKEWTAASAAMAASELIGVNKTGYTPPVDTGEAADLDPAKLTITFGVGPTLFRKKGKNRFGLAHKVPKELKKLPAFSLDALDEEWSDGDLCVQVCSNDAQVNFHAIRNLVRIARGKAVLKWGQEGFQGNDNPKAKKKETPRNLFGFKDETVNLSPEKADSFADHVWVKTGDGPNWLAGGSYLVVRRIQMHIEVWDRTALGEQESTFGRHRVSGAPLGKKDEFEDMGLDRKDESGELIVATDAHVRSAHGTGKEQLYRRSYSYSSGMSVNTGTLNAGLFFMCYQRFPSKQFIPIQKRLGNSDKLNEYITHRGSAIFACLPGVKKGGWIGETLFG